MAAPPSPVLSNTSITSFSEEGFNGYAESDHCSPETKRARRDEPRLPSSWIEESDRRNFLEAKFLGGVRESESNLSFRSACDFTATSRIEHAVSSNHSLPTLNVRAMSVTVSAIRDRGLNLEENVLCERVNAGGKPSERGCRIERNGNSCHSLPTLDIQALTVSDSACCGLSLEQNVLRDRVGSVDNVAKLEREPSPYEEAEDDRVGDDAEVNNDRKLKVVSRYYNHYKENQQLVGSDLGSHKTNLTASIEPSHLDVLEPLSEATKICNGATALEVLDKETIKMKFGLSEVTYESGEDRIRQILMPTPLETWIGSGEHYENCSAANSVLEDNASQRGLRSTGTASEATARTTVGNSGDSQTWNSHLEKEYKSRLEFSTLVTLAYVRVRDLTNTINKASSYLEIIEKTDSQTTNDIAERRSEIQLRFEERAKLALEQNKWRCQFSKLYSQRKKALSNLKSQALLAEQSYFKLRRDLEELQNEPIVAKPKRSWFSRLCAFIK